MDGAMISITDLVWDSRSDPGNAPSVFTQQMMADTFTAVPSEVARCKEHTSVLDELNHCFLCEIPKKFVEAVGLAEQLNDPSRPVQTGQKIFQNQLESLKQLLNQEQQDTLHLKEQIAVERQLRENLRVRLDHMEHEVHHSIQPTASGEKNGKTIIVMAPSSNNAENIVFENARSHNQENVNSVNHKPGQIAKKKKTAVKKKKKKKKRPVKSRKRSQTIQLQIPKSTARVLLAYRENL
jgi:hypothetical protein